MGSPSATHVQLAALAADVNTGGAEESNDATGIGVVIIIAVIGIPKASAATTTVAIGQHRCGRKNMIPQFLGSIQAGSSDLEWLRAGAVGERYFTTSESIAGIGLAGSAGIFPAIRGQGLQAAGLNHQAVGAAEADIATAGSAAGAEGGVAE